MDNIYPICQNKLFNFIHLHSKPKVQSIITIEHASQFPRSNRKQQSLEYTILELPRHFLGTEIVLRTSARAVALNIY